MGNKPVLRERQFAKDAIGMLRSNAPAAGGTFDLSVSASPKSRLIFVPEWLR
jgi:hypothetical protein